MSDLGPILDTLREVNVSLERRARRAGAANEVTWGLVASGIFAFYAWSLANVDAPLVAALRDAGFLRWMWVPPVLVGYAITLAIGARLGRIAPRSDEAKGTRWVMLVLLVPVALVTLATVTQTGTRFIPGMWLVFLGVVRLGAGCAKGAWVERVATWGGFALAPVVLALPVAQAFVATCAWYVFALAGVGLWRYYRA